MRRIISAVLSPRSDAIEASKCAVRQNGGGLSDIVDRPPRASPGRSVLWRSASANLAPTEVGNRQQHWGRSNSIRADRVQPCGRSGPFCEVHLGIDIASVRKIWAGRPSTSTPRAETEARRRKEFCVWGTCHTKVTVAISARMLPPNLHLPPFRPASHCMRCFRAHREKRRRRSVGELCQW